MLKPKIELNLLSEDSEDIYLQTKLETYLKKPTQLDSLTLLQYCVNTSKYFTVQYLNTQITFSYYGYSESMNALGPIDRSA